MLRKSYWVLKEATKIYKYISTIIIFITEKRNILPNTLMIALKITKIYRNNKPPWNIIITLKNISSARGHTFDHTNFIEFPERMQTVFIMQ